MPDEQQDNNRSLKAHPSNTYLWMALLALGFIYEFIGRLFGFRGNPTGLWLEIAPLLTTLSAALVIIYASFELMGAWTKRSLMDFRRSLLTMTLGTSMLIGSMVCKSIVRLLFG